MVVQRLNVRYSWKLLGEKNLDLNKQFRTVYDMKYHYDM
jgi:hypothetical protein